MASSQTSSDILNEETARDDEMRAYIRDMLSGLSEMAAEARLTDLSALLRIAVREAEPAERTSVDAAALRTVLSE